MEYKELIKKRQSIRRYKLGEVKREDILEMIDAARLAPSGKNIQNWHFLVISDVSKKEKLGEIIYTKNQEIADKMEAVDKDKADRFRKFAKNFTLFFTTAPVVVLVMSKVYIPSGYAEISLFDDKHADLDELMGKRNPGMQSVGACIENFYLRAVDLGYGLCWLTSANYAYKEIEAYIKDLGFKEEDWFFSALLSIGIPEEDQKSPGKLAVEEIVSWLD
jgi:nitroreductase